MGTLVAAYFVYNIQASNFLGGLVFKCTGPIDQWIQNYNVKAWSIYACMSKSAQQMLIQVGIQVAIFSRWIASTSMNKKTLYFPSETINTDSKRSNSVAFTTNSF